MTNKITLVFMGMLLMCISVLRSQTLNVTGTVTDTSKEPVIGATILVKGSPGIGTAADIDGKFTLSVPTGSTLIFSSVGFTTLEKQATANMSVVMDADANLLDEVIVQVAYGAQKKSTFTGSAAIVGAKQLEKRPITTVAAAIEGNAPGVQVTSGLGQPGESAGIRIRGVGSYNASNDPLYVLDGAIYNGNLSNLNPNDIESVTILKDAASTALYGSSAGNGVILITTKLGRSEAASVNLSITHGWSSRAYKDYAVVDAYDYMPLQWLMLKNSYVSANIAEADAAQRATNELYSKLGSYNPFAGAPNNNIVGTDGKLNPAVKGLKWRDDLDWEDAAFSTSPRKEYNLSYNSKSDKSSTYASIGYLNDQGYMLKTGFERYSLRINYNFDPVKWLSSGVRANLARTASQYSTSDSDNSSGYSNLVRFIRGMAPIYPIHKHDGDTGAYLDKAGKPTTNPADYVYDYDSNRLSSTGRDAIAETLWNDRKISRVNSTGSGFITLKPIDGLSVTGNYSIEINDLRRKVYENPLVGDGTAGPGRMNILSTRSTTQTASEIINYVKDFGNHSIDVLLGHENYEYQYEYYYSMKTNEIFSDVYEYGNFTNISSLSSYTDTYRKEGYLARVNYDFADKYYLSASYRYDGSSRFHPDHRWGNFYSVGASWRIIQEEFMKDIDWLNNLKIRASYGETGNDRTSGYYPYQSVYDLGNNNSGDAGVFLGTASNSLLKWETQKSADIGIEFKVFERLDGTIEWFNKTSSDLLFNVSLPTSTGFSSITRNLGEFKNTGVEFDLGYEFIRNKDWIVSARINGTLLKNTITKLPPENRENGIIDGSKKLMEGNSMYTFWLRQWYGVDPATGNGLFYIDEKYLTDKPENADAQKTIVTIADKKLTNDYSYAKYDYSGTSIPDITGGFNFNIGYKGITLGAVFSYQLGGVMLDSNYQSLMGTNEYGGGMHPDLLNAWKKPGDVSTVPRIDANATHNTNIATSYSTRWLVSSDYLNLRSLTLSYVLPKSLITRWNLRNINVSLSAENLFMLKARQGLNPMGYFTGLNYNAYQPSKNITLGLNLSF